MLLDAFWGAVGNKNDLQVLGSQQEITLPEILRVLWAGLVWLPWLLVGVGISGLDMGAKPGPECVCAWSLLHYQILSNPHFHYITDALPSQERQFNLLGAPGTSLEQWLVGVDQQKLGEKCVRSPVC